MTTKEALWHTYLQLEGLFTKSSVDLKIDRKQLPAFLRIIPDGAFAELAKQLPLVFRQRIAQSLVSCSDEQALAFARFLVNLVEPLRLIITRNGHSGTGATGTIPEPEMRHHRLLGKREDNAGEGAPPAV